MNKIQKFLIVLTVVSAAVWFIVPSVVGAILEPKLEKELTDLFGMPVTIDYLRVSPVSGEVRSGRVCFHNIPPFSKTPHLDVHQLEFDIRFPELLHHRVVIGRIVLKRPVFVVERAGSEDGPVNNLSTWVHHMKSDDVNEPEAEGEPSSGPSSWTVTIGKIIIENGTFRTENRTDVSGFFNMTFTHLNGHLSGFAWPTPDPVQMPEDVSLKGKIGERYPAPFTISGKANFATSAVSFDLTGKIPEGNFLEYPYMWENLPLKITRGRFSLDARGVCRQDRLKVKNTLILESLHAEAASGMKGTLWGMPLKASMAFLEDEKKIVLEIPVDGDITNPNFKVQKAFRQAFQDALGRSVVNGFKFLKEGSSVVVQKTEDLAMKTPGHLLQSVTKISTTVAENTLRATDSVWSGLKPQNETKKQTGGDSHE